MGSVRPVSYRGAVEYEVAEGGDAGPFFVLGVRKSGSSILNSMVQAVAEMNGLTFIDVAGKLFASGLPASEWQEDPGLCAILAPGNVYGGFRNAPKGFYKSPLYKSGKKILLVRDPRDALVSEYFSNAYSHSLPEGGDLREGMLALRQSALQSSIDAYVGDMARSLKRVLREYMPLAKDPLCRTFRYEEVIFRKGELLDEICAHFEWRLAPQQRAAILGWADVLPSEERPTEFIRRVTPGDHREKLSAEVIRRLDTLFAPEMKHFGYA
jgi:hypothetical protein